MEGQGSIPSNFDPPCILRGPAKISHVVVLTAVVVVGGGDEKFF